MPQGHEYENPQVSLALSDLFRVKGIPARGQNVSGQVRVNLEASRELYLQAYRLTRTVLTGDEQVHATILCRHPHVVLTPELTVDVIANHELTFVDGENRFHRGVSACAINSFMS